MFRLAAALVFACSVTFAATAGADAPDAAGAIVKGKDDDAIEEIMKSFNKALKVKCNHCHVREDGKFQYKKWTPKKRIALYMFTHYTQKMKTADGEAVTCNTCHRGRKTFLKKIGKGD